MLKCAIFAFFRCNGHPRTMAQVSKPKPQMQFWIIRKNACILKSDPFSYYYCIRICTKKGHMRLHRWRYWIQQKKLKDPKYMLPRIQRFKLLFINQCGAWPFLLIWYLFSFALSPNFTFILFSSVCSNKKTIDTINGQKLRISTGVNCGAVSNLRISSSENFIMTRKGLPSNVYGFEFRFRQKAYELDTTVIRCPIKRSACKYLGNVLITCDSFLDTTYLKSYSLTVIIKQAFRDKVNYPAEDGN